MSKTAAQIFQEEVKSLQAARNCSYDEAYQLSKVFNRALYAEVQANTTEEKRMANSREALSNAGAASRKAASKKFTALVNEKMKATGLSYDQAYQGCKYENPGLVNEMNLPPKLTTSSDGQFLYSKNVNNLSPEMLFKLGLPMNAEPEQIRIYVNADKAEFTPAAAAYLVRSFIRAGQFAGGKSFDEVLETIKEIEPDIYKLATQATKKLL